MNSNHLGHKYAQIVYVNIQTDTVASSHTLKHAHLDTKK